MLLLMFILPIVLSYSCINYTDLIVNNIITIDNIDIIPINKQVSLINQFSSRDHDIECDLMPMNIQAYDLLNKLLYKTDELYLFYTNHLNKIRG